MISYKSKINNKLLKILIINLKKIKQLTSHRISSNNLTKSHLIIISQMDQDRMLSHSSLTSQIKIR